VAANGPFSSFPGIDRTLSVLSGTLGLEIAGTRVDLMEMSPPHSFPGEAAVHGIVLRGPVMDLNVMTRRETLRHDVRRVAVAGEKTVIVEPGTLILFCHTGAVALPNGEQIQALDTAIGETPGGAIVLKSASPSTLYVITITLR
jgi:environmental stress-induced protein Ves